jgi:hypothetical protein
VLKIEESALKANCGPWSLATYASFSNNLIRLKAGEPKFNEYGEDEDDDVVEVEAVMDISLCKFHALKIIAPSKVGTPAAARVT